VVKVYKDHGVSGAKRLGRPPISPALKERIVAALSKPDRTEGVRKIATRFGVNPSTVQGISWEL
jgi:transposase-like protein